MSAYARAGAAVARGAACGRVAARVARFAHRRSAARIATTR
jgi:hypothetical protein